MASSTGSKVIETARERFQFTQEAESLWRRLCLDDLRFAQGEIDGRSTQWEETDQTARAQAQRPCITINRQNQFLYQVTNEARQNNPSIRISPVDDGADIETAEILQGLTRHIEVASNADIARAAARKTMVASGIGYTRLMLEYANNGDDLERIIKSGGNFEEAAFDQDIRFGPPVLNPFSIYLDPGALESDRSDAQFGFITSSLTKEQHKRLYPKAELSSIADMSSIGDSVDDWVGREGIRIAEYFSREVQLRTIVAAEVPVGGAPMVIVGWKKEIPPGARILRSREVEFPTIHHRKINGVEILEETTWPGRYIPVIPYIGEEAVIDGYRIISGMVRAAKPAQRMYNFWVSALTEMIGMSPKAPYLVPVAGLQGYQDWWDRANKENFIYLPYNHVDEHGGVIPPPTRQAVEAPIQAISAAIMQADRDMKATFGIYEAGLGQRGPQESGRAIQARKVEGEIATYHLIDNESRARHFEGKQILDLIPRVINREKAMRIIGMDETPSTVVVNSQRPVKYKQMERIFDLRVGRYDVTVSTGPGFQTKRQQAAEALSALVSAYPQIMEIAGDLVVKAQDFPYAQELAERMKSLIPAANEGEEEQNPIPPEVQQRMQQDAALIEDLTKQLSVLSEQMKAKTAEIESKERISAADNETKLMIAELQANTDKAIALLREETAGIRARMDAKRAEDDREYQREAGEAERGLKAEMATAKAAEKQETP